MPDEAPNEAARHWPHDRERSYANHLEIAFALSEVELCFSQEAGSGSDLEARHWVLTSPTNLVHFGRAISRTIASYEGRFGRLPESYDAADMPVVKQ